MTFMVAERVFIYCCVSFVFQLLWSTHIETTWWCSTVDDEMAYVIHFSDSFQSNFETRIFHN